MTAWDLVFSRNKEGKAMLAIAAIRPAITEAIELLNSGRASIAHECLSDLLRQLETAEHYGTQAEVAGERVNAAGRVTGGFSRAETAA